LIFIPGIGSTADIRILNPFWGVINTIQHIHLKMNMLNGVDKKIFHISQKNVSL